MKSTIQTLLQQALDTLKQSGDLALEVHCEIKVERSKDNKHGDFATNIALVIAKSAGKPPRMLAELLIQSLPECSDIKKVEIAGPGFINFFVDEVAHTQVIRTVIEQDETYGQGNLGQNQPVLLEYVSANPTGPLHVGHGRGAAFGASLANLLQVAGFSVTREYYVNDAGRQMNILAASVWLRYIELAGQSIVFPANGYRGQYVIEIAQALLVAEGEKLVQDWASIAAVLPDDEPQGGDKEIYIDAVVNVLKARLGEANFALVHRFGLEAVLEDIKTDLAEFGVVYDRWFSEQSLSDSGAIEKGIQALKDGGHTFEQNGALWFRATDFGDEKDRVLIRANGQTTYFASDVAYHWDKYDRGFKRVVDVFGADHHGYVTRVKSAVKALGHDEAALDVLLVQFAVLYRGSERVQMSTRSGSFVTLRELRNEVGKDAARFFYVMRKPEQHMDFDLELAKSQSNENPVYYVQYAHARICSVLRQLKERQLNWQLEEGLENSHLLSEPQEQHLMTLLSQYPETIEAAAKACEPHQVAYYLRALATGLHSYYNAVPLLCEQQALRSARLALLTAVRQVLRNGMNLIGVSTPESM